MILLAILCTAILAVSFYLYYFIHTKYLIFENTRWYLKKPEDRAYISIYKDGQICYRSMSGDVEIAHYLLLCTMVKYDDFRDLFLGVCKAYENICKTK